jgi:hypothetical protein
MSDRLCGYCRKPGHSVPKCEIKKKQLDTILTMVPRQRKLIHDIAIQNGIGPGALVNAYDWWTGEDVLCVVPSLKNMFTHASQLVTYKDVKYSKKVISMIRVANIDELPSGDSHDLIRWIKLDRFQVECYPLHDMSKTMTANFYIRSLPNRPSAYKTDGPINQYFGDRHSAIVSPSYDTDVVDSDFLGDIVIDDRLCSTNHLMPGRWE